MITSRPFSKAIVRGQRPLQRPNQIYFPASQQARRRGSSGSAAPDTTILNVKPGTCFTHSNIANVLTPTDIYAMSVAKYAVNALKMKHIVVCGHTGCGGCKVALGNARVGKTDTWLQPLRQVRLKHAEGLKMLEGFAQGTRLAGSECYDRVEVLKQQPDVIRAIKERGLTVDGMIFDGGSGLLRKLNIPDRDVENRSWALETS